MEIKFEIEWPWFYCCNMTNNKIKKNIPEKNFLYTDEKIVYNFRGFYWEDSKRDQQPKMWFKKLILYKNGDFSYFNNGNVRKLVPNKHFKYIMNIICDMISNIKNKLFKPEEKGTVNLILNDIYNWVFFNFPKLKDFIINDCYNLSFISGLPTKCSYIEISKAIDYVMMQPKQIKKNVFKKGICGIVEFYNFKYIGLTDKNIMLELINSNGFANMLMKPKASRYYFNCLKKVYGSKADVILAQRLRKYDKDYTKSFEIYDTFKFLSLYLYLKNKNNENFIVYSDEEIAKFSLKELHDVIFRDCRNSIMTYYNAELSKPLTMSDERKKFDNIEVDGVKFFVPKNFLEFCEMGEKFHNCVVSYYGKAQRQDCHIICAFKNNEPFACIELSKEKVIYQCLNVNNKCLSKENYDICSKYFKIIGAIEFFPNDNDIVGNFNGHRVVIEEELPF